MTNPTITTVTFPPIVAGDKWEGHLFQFAKEGFDFTGTTATSKLRKKTPSGDVVHTFALTPVVVEEGQMSVTPTLTAEETLAIGPGHYIGDLVIHKASTLGPLTPVRYKLQIEARITK